MGVQHTVESLHRRALGDGGQDSRQGYGLRLRPEITIKGKTVKFDAYVLKDTNGNLTNYVKLRDVAVALNGTAAQFEVGYSNETGSSINTAGQ